MPMTLLDARPEKPKGVLRRYPVPWILVLVRSAAVLYFLFRNYREERAVTRFLPALRQGQ